MKNIKLKDIKPCTWNARGEITAESVKELARSIDENGLINPITLWYDGNGDIYCIAGNRRLAALRALHSNDFEGELPKDHYTIFGGDEREAKMVTVTENLQREDVGVVEEAELVTQCLDNGMSIDEVAAKTGRSKTWVRQRAKLAMLDAKWSAFAKAHPNAITADALERIAAYPTEIQRKVWTMRKPSESCIYKWDEFKWAFERESCDIESSGIAKDKKLCAKCRQCAKRTGAEADLFGETDGGLGRCLDQKCFAATRESYEDQRIHDAVGSSEAVRVNSSWQVPSEADGERRTKAKPCAYVYFDGEGEPVVKWGPSKSAMDNARREAEAERESHDAELREKRKRIGGITERLDAYFDCQRDDSVLKARAEMLVGKHTDAELDFITDAIVERLTNYRSPHEWADFLRTFQWAAGVAGVSEDDVNFLTGEFPEGNEDE